MQGSAMGIHETGKGTKVNYNVHLHAFGGQLISVSATRHCNHFVEVLGQEQQPKWRATVSCNIIHHAQ